MFNFFRNIKKSKAVSKYGQAVNENRGTMNQFIGCNVENSRIDTRTPKEKFIEYLNDFENWERTQGREDTYYYTKDHRFKIIRLPVDDDKHFPIDDMPCYGYLLSDFGISTDYWEYHKRGGTYEDYANFFDVELFVDNTSVGKYMIAEFYSKYYFLNKNLMKPWYEKFYIPSINVFEECKHPKDKNGRIIYGKNITNKETLFDAIANDFVFKICRMLYQREYGQDSDIDSPYRDKYIFGSNYEKVLDFLNWDALTSDSYWKQNADYIDEIVINPHMGSREWVRELRKNKK